MKEIGYLYVLANSAMPNMVKVGKTTRTPSERADELSRATGLPIPFIVVYEQLFSDCGEAESFVHTYLEANGYRVANNREFFNAPVSVVVKAIALAPNAIDNEAPMSEAEEDDGLIEHGDEYDELDDLSLNENEQDYPWTSVFEEAEDHYYGLRDYIQDYSEAMRLYKQAAKLVSLAAYGCIGNMYRDGEGVREDKNKALNFYKEGARKGSVYCYWAMAMLFRDEGNLSNAEKCFSLFFKNYKNNFPDGQQLTRDELDKIFRNCILLIKYKINGHYEFSFVLNNFIFKNRAAISSASKNMMQITRNNHSELSKEYETVVEYLSCLKKD